jgi:hypothetical protein
MIPKESVAAMELWNDLSKTRTNPAWFCRSLEYEMARKPAPLLAPPSGLSRRGSRVRVPSTRQCFDFRARSGALSLFCFPFG